MSSNHSPTDNNTQNGHHIQQHQVNQHPSSMSSNNSNPMLNTAASKQQQLSKPSTTITRPRNQMDHNSNLINSSLSHTHNRPQNTAHGVVSEANNYVYQMGMARNAASPKSDDYDPDSNVYVANLPSDYGKERLYKLFQTYGPIVRYKFVTPDEPSQPGYGFVQFANRKDAHRAIKNLEGHMFVTGETIYLSIALRRRSSLSDEPTNLYVKNLPSSWTNDKLRKVFGAYGHIRQSKVVGDGIGFVRYEDHEQALNAIGRLDKQMVDGGSKLEVRFATRKTAANAYRLQQIPQSKSNENNLYIRNLPKYYNQSSLETLFANYGKISSAKINDNGIAFVRFAHAEDAKRAIQELNGKKPPQFDEEIVVKLAHFDIGDSRNRWTNKFGSGGGSSQHGGGGGGNHFNNNMYQNHFNAPIGSMTGGGLNNYGYSGSMANGTPLPSVPTSAVSSQDNHNIPNPSQDVNVNVNMNNLNVTSNQQPNMMQQMQLNNQIQIQAIQQQLNQLNLQQNSQQMVAAANQGGMMHHSPDGHALIIAHQNTKGNAVNGATANVQLNQFAFPTATMMPTLFANNAMAANQQQNTNQLPSLPRQISNDSHHSVGSGAASPQSNHSASSNDKAATWSKKQQRLGDQLYQKVFAKTGKVYAPKITGMLIKMGDQKAQQCIDDPSFLDEQIKVAKQLLENTEGVPSGHALHMPNGLSPTSLLQQKSGSPTSNNLMNRYNVNSPNPMTATTPTNRYQALHKPVTPNTTLNGGGLTSPNSANPQMMSNATNNALNAAQMSSIPGLMPSSIQNPLYNAMPRLFHATPQLFANSHVNGGTTPNSANKTQPMQNHQVPGLTNTSSNTATTPQYLFAPVTAPMQNLVASPTHQQQLMNVNGVNVVTTPNTLEQQHQQQQRHIQQGGWGLALNPQMNVLQAQPTAQFMQSSLYPRSQ
eukprot:100313_1